METFYTPYYLAQILNVSPASIYMWLSLTKDPTWEHKHPPAPTNRVCKSIKHEEEQFSPVWTKPQIEEWVTWYKDYQESKYKNKNKD